MEFGLVSFGSALGEPSSVDEVLPAYTDDLERVRGYGYTVVHRAADAVGLTDLALAAARQALAAADVEPGEVDLIVLGLTDLAEYLYWDPSASLQFRLGAQRAETQVVTQACTAGLAGLDLIAGRFATHPDYDTALLVAANRTCEPYWNRMAMQSMVFSDGAAATVARRGHPSLRLLASEAMTDGRYADFYRMQVGGAARPFTAGLTEQPTAQDSWDIMEFFDYDEDEFNGFVRLINERGRLMVERACTRVGAKMADLRALISLHDNRRSFESLAADMGLPIAATNMELGLRTGHLGAADQLFSLATMVHGGAFAPGDLVALVGLGRGMHWACALVEA